jgi:murein tripeptide amidase MpaA
MHIVSDLDGGNVIVKEVSSDDEGNVVARLGIRHDTHAPEFRQWFHFAVSDVAGDPIELVIEDLDQTTYPDAWEEYAVCASYDLETWFRVPTTYANDELRWSITPEAQRIYFAYFAPYGQQRHRAFLDQLAEEDGVSISTLGKSVQGRAVELVTVGDPEREDALKIWVIARQHPGETMAQWFAEGLLAKLMDTEHDTVAELRERCTFYVVPTMNPDGGVLGNLRANAAGENLNRAWLEPSEARSPEVLCVRAKMQETGVDAFLDVHGDERNPWCFLAGCEGNPGYDDRLRELENLFEQTLLELDDDFQDEYGYPRDEPGGGDLRTAGNWVGETFDCLSFTVEMPFKDAANNPDEERGFSPERAKRLGASALEAIAACLDELR